MRTSKFSQEEKLQILTEQEFDNISVEEICVKYGISVATFYSWKREIIQAAELDTQTFNAQELRKENHTLRQLYIDLSEHNHQLAQFLSK